MYIQFVRFKLAPDVSRQVFLELTNEMICMLKKKDGFIAYELYEGQEYWADRISWEREEHAKTALNEFLATPIANQLLRMVESGYSSFFGEAVISV